MALLKSLKKVLTELGGTPDPKDSTTKTIEKIADNVSGGGSGDVVVVKCPVTIENEDNVWTATKTAGELWAADFIIWEAGDNWAKILCPAKYYDGVSYVFLVRVYVNGQGQASIFQLEAGSAEDYPTNVGGD